MGEKQKQEHEESLNLTLRLFKECNSMPEIAYKRRLAFSTIENHLRRLLEDGKLNINDLLSEEKIELIKNASKEYTYLSEIKRKVPANITYTEIKYVLTSLGKLRTRKTPVAAAVNTYIGNYCYRKCFKHDEIIVDCIKKFLMFIEKAGKTPITFEELKGMINNDEIMICKLPPEKRKVYISWSEFERLKKKDKDFWDNSTSINVQKDNPQSMP